jgi:hypothetical protein
LPPRHENARLYNELLLRAAPSKKSVLRIRKVSEPLTPADKRTWPGVQARLNRVLGGSSAYFGYGSVAAATQIVDRDVFGRVLAFPLRRGGVEGITALQR